MGESQPVRGRGRPRSDGVSPGDQPPTRAVAAPPDARGKLAPVRERIRERLGAVRAAPGQWFSVWQWANRQSADLFRRRYPEMFEEMQVTCRQEVTADGKRAYTMFVVYTPRNRWQKELAITPGVPDETGNPVG